MIVQHCQVKGRRGCGHVATVWVRMEWNVWKTTTSVIKAACPEHAEGKEVLEPIVRVVKGAAQ